MISAYDVPKSLSRDSNYTVDVVMCGTKVW